MSNQTRCPFCCSRISYLPNQEGQLGGCPHCQMSIKIVSPEKAEEFISSEQYLKIARAASPYKGIRTSINIVFAFLCFLAIAFAVRSFTSIPLPVEAVLFLYVPSLLGGIGMLLFIRVLIFSVLDIADVQITGNRLQLYFSKR